MNDAAIAALFREILSKDKYVSKKYGQVVECLSRPASPSENPRAPSENARANSPSENSRPNSPQQRRPRSPFFSPDPPRPASGKTPEIIRLEQPASPDVPAPHRPPPTCSESAMDTQDYPASESDVDFSPADSDSDGYTLVGKKRKAKKASPPAAPKAQKTALKAPPSSASKATSKTTPSQGQSKSGPVPPPIYIQDKAKWQAMSNWCDSNRDCFTDAKLSGTGIKVTVPCPTAHRILTRVLRERNISFHTYALQEERLLRVVLRGVPKEFNTQDVLNDLKSQHIPVLEVHRMHRRGGESFDMVLAVCEKTEGYKAIFSIRTVCRLSGITVERPYKSGVIGQCHNCQLYGHSQRNCFAKPRCVKCLGDHSTSDCNRPKDPKLCKEPPSCVLCGEAGHPANYRGCPKAPKKPSPKLAKRATARSKRECPSLSNQIPQNLRPQRPAQWDQLDHQRSSSSHSPSAPGQNAQPTSTLPPSAPPAVPAPSVPTTHSAPPAPVAATRSYAHPKAPPAPANRTAATKAPQATKPATATPITAAPQQSSHLLPILKVWEILDSQRAKDMSLELVRNVGNPIGIIQTIMNYPDIRVALASLTFN